MQSFIPAELYAEPHTRIRAKFIIGFAVIYFFFGIALASSHFAFGMTLHGSMIGLTVPIVAAAPSILWKTRSLKIVAHSLAAIFVWMSIVLALAAGESTWRSLIWLGPTVMYAMFLGGRRVASVWVVVGTLEILVFHVLGAFHLLPAPAPIPMSSLLDTVSLVVLLGVTFSIAFIFDREYELSLRTLNLTSSELRASRERAEVAQRMARVGHYEADFLTQNVRVSNVLLELYGRPDAPSKMTLQESLSFFHPEDVAAIAGSLQQIAAGEAPQAFDYRVVLPDGTVRNFRGHSQAVLDADGKVVGIRGTGQDVTEAKNNEAQILQAREAALSASRAKSQFLANMSHEIRTPMNGIIGMTKLALDSKLEGEAREYVNAAHASSESLLGILNDILDLSKVEAGRLVLENIPFVLADVLRDVVQTVALRAHVKDLELLVDCDESLARRFHGDPMRLRQILLNLAGNAVKFTERGEVILTVRPVPDRPRSIRFSVRDSGPGIPADAHARIFEAFRQADESMSRKFGGTGLGLTISRQLAELMNGRLSLESTPGIGSVFSAEVELAPINEDYSLEEGVLPKGTVFILDDHELAREMMSRSLGERGLKTRGVATFEELQQELAQTTQVAAVIIDRKLGERDGLELCHQLDLSKRSLRKILLICADARPDNRSLARAGIFRALLKPATTSALFDAITACETPPLDLSVAIADADNHGLSVLLAEDNPVNALLATRVLERIGHRVTRVATGAQAVELAFSSHFDVVLMDVQMPVLDGLEATRLIRAHEAEHGGHLPIIALTANAMKEDDLSCLAAGMDAYLTKPLEPSRLKETVRRFSPRAAVRTGSTPG